MTRQLVTCPVCKTDQHVYAKKIAKHQGVPGFNCFGSGTPLNHKEMPKAPMTAKELAQKLMELAEQSRNAGPEGYTAYTVIKENLEKLGF